jgi:hypothetical protein
LPTSLTNYTPRTRGCSPGRPVAVSGTTNREGDAKTCMTSHTSLLSAPWIFKGRRRRPKDASESEALCRPSNLISGRADSEVVRARPRLPPHKPLHKNQHSSKEPTLQVAPKSKHFEKARLLLKNKQGDGKLRTRGRQGEERTLLGASDNVSKVPRVTAWR